MNDYFEDEVEKAFSSDERDEGENAVEFLLQTIFLDSDITPGDEDIVFEVAAEEQTESFDSASVSATADSSMHFLIFPYNGITDQLYLDYIFFSRTRR